MSNRLNVTIVIPVYNAFEESLACLTSVVKQTKGKCNILVLDDASPQGDFAAYMKKASISDSRMNFVRNQTNLGFVGSCNRGILELAPKDDIVLLNSDTEVTNNWLTKLQSAAYSAEKIGTVTPLTNNGTICSVPKFGTDNVLPTGYSLEQFASLVEQVSKREYVKLPTCVGFCTYVRREMLDAVGAFDAEGFGKGYGEENDLSLRAQKLGFSDILDDSTFIYHKGSCSFKESKRELIETNSKIIRQRYPTYFDDVSKFCREFPIYSVHRRIHFEMLQRWSKKRGNSVLHIVHNGPNAERHHPLGGTELHVKDLISNAEKVDSWSLVPTSQCYYLTAHLPDFDCEFILNAKTTPLTNILKPEFFDLVHLHHAKGFNFGEIQDALAKHGNYIVSVHDFYSVCPRVNLLTPTRQHCDGFQCGTACAFGDYYITEYRRIAGELFNQAAGSGSIFEQYEGIYSKILKSAVDKVNWRIAPHGILGAKNRNELELEISLLKNIDNQSNPLKLAFLGYIPHHKGSLIIEKLLKVQQLKSGRAIEWHVFGELYLDAPKYVVQHGRYQRDQLNALVEKARPDLALILSICPETYCLTLDEAWNNALPVLVTPLGAPAERVAATGAGWVLSELTDTAVLESIERISSSPKEYQAVQEKIAQAGLLSISQEVNAFQVSYQKYRPRKIAQVRDLLAFLEPTALREPPRRSLVAKYLGAC